MPLEQFIDWHAPYLSINIVKPPINYHSEFEITVTLCTMPNNIHTKIPAFLLAESMPINPKYCKNLNIF